MKNKKDASDEKENNLHAGHRERLKSRFLKGGLKEFEPHNVLELLLFYSTPQKDVNDTAHKLVNEFGSISAVFDADFDELIKVKGVKEHTATLLKLIPELAREYYDDLYKRTNKKAFNIDALCEYLIRLFAGKKTEEVYLLLFDDVDSLCFTTLIDRGSLKNSSVSVKNVAQTALRMGYDKIALAHNHPGGTAIPSMEDIESTVNLKRSLSVCGIDLCVHFIVAGTQCVGMLDWERTRLITETVTKRMNKLT